MSNWRESENVVESLIKEERQGRLECTSIFLATYNLIVEGSLYKGKLWVEKLFDIVVRLNSLEMIHGCTISVTLVAETRMQT